MSRNALRRFVEGLEGSRDQNAVRTALNAWFHEVKRVSWKSPADVKEKYANASFVGSERIVFNIKGNSYRLVVGVDYHRGIVFIKWFGSHAEYDRIDVRKVNYGD